MRESSGIPGHFLINFHDVSWLNVLFKVQAPALVVFIDYFRSHLIKVCLSRFAMVSRNVIIVLVCSELLLTAGQLTIFTIKQAFKEASSSVFLRLILVVLMAFAFDVGAGATCVRLR